VRTIQRTEGSRTLFVVTDVDPDYISTLRALAFSEVEDGFAKAYATDTPDLGRYYRHFARSIEEMVLQAAGVHAAPWDVALLALLRRMESHHIDWWLAGSAALAVRSLDVIPHDLDLIVDGPGAHALGAVLFDSLVGPVEETNEWISRWFGRAFLYVRIEWAGDVFAQVDELATTDFGPEAARRLESVTWRGYSIRVPPLALQLEVCRRRGLHTRAEQIARALHQAT
jgi:hypothetical protein